MFPLMSYPGPNINMVKDPRYGRNSELAGEDPFLTGTPGVVVVVVCVCVSLGAHLHRLHSCMYT